MQHFTLPMFLRFAVVVPVAAQTDSIQLTETNLIVLCASNSDVVAHVKIDSLTLVCKPTYPTLYICLYRL